LTGFQARKYGVEVLEDIRFLSIIAWAQGKTLKNDHFGIRRKLPAPFSKIGIYSLTELGKKTGRDLSSMPRVLRILLESIARNVDGKLVKEEDALALMERDVKSGERREVPFMPARILMQDFTGVPALVDLAVMRDALKALSGDPERINPKIPVDLVIDHSIQVDHSETREAAGLNAAIEFERNRERYKFLRWGAESFDNLSVVPPATGICHQVNLEYLARVVRTAGSGGDTVAFPDTLVGTDSHTPMIDGIGVLGWGVGGIEAEAAVLGKPLYMLVPDVIGLRLSGTLRPGTTPTDIVLFITELLRTYGVVGKLVEFTGPGVGSMSVTDRALVSNMSPETGATALFFPVDERTLEFLRQSGRSDDLVGLVEAYTRVQGLFGYDETPGFTDVVELDLSDIEPSIAGPRRPHDRIPLTRVGESVKRMLSGRKSVETRIKTTGGESAIKDGSVVIAAITSCTNTSNPTVMIGAGLLAKKAVERGLSVPGHVKTSLAPGSRVVTRYLREAGLLSSLESLGFYLVGYGCTTCIGNSGPLLPGVSEAVRKHGLVVAGVLSGNRNFEGRIHQDVRANYLASPPLVVAYALAGSMKDLTREPVGRDRDGKAVFLKDIWPSEDEVRQTVLKAVSPDFFREEYGSVYSGNETWNRVSIRKSKTYAWSGESTYIRKPPFFDGLTKETGRPLSIEGARVLALLGDSVTTDHISPAGSIPPDGPAGKWLIGQGVEQKDFNSFGSRRGNHEVMMRGTFANIRLRNLLLYDIEGGMTMHFPSNDIMPVYDAAIRYGDEGVPLIVMAGEEYGSGSSRDWAAKGTQLLGVRAVLARGFERIHRSNLIGMGVLPLQFEDGESAPSLGLTGKELFDIDVPAGPAERVGVRARSEDGTEIGFTVTARIDTPVEYEYWVNGGILHTVLRGMA